MAQEPNNSIGGSGMTLRSLKAIAIPALIALASIATPAAAQDWPTRPIRMLIGFGAGGGTDIVGRIVAQPLAELLGQPIVIENRPGAGGTIAATAVARADKDGYTAFMLNSGHTVSAVMYKALQYDSVKDFQPVSLVATAGLIVVSNKNFPVKDLKELIAKAKAEPGKLDFATVGVGSTQHFSAELLRQNTGADIKHIPYRGTPAAITAVLAGEDSAAV